MKKQNSVKIDTVPLPERPVSVDIPVKYLKEFKTDLRVVFKHEFINGIPIPEYFLENLVKNKEMYRDLSRRFDIMFIPK